MIDPGGIPQYHGEPAQIIAQAQALRSGADTFAATGQDVHGTWQGLGGVYTAPESGQLLSATQQVADRSAALAGDVDGVAAALVAFAETMTPIKARLRQLAGEARAFVASVAGDDDWAEDGDKVDRHNAMLSEVGSLVAEWQAAERACANAIHAAFGSDFRYRQDDGDETVEADEYGYGEDTYDAALEQEVDLPWGTIEHEDENGFVSFVKGLVGDGAWGDVQGLGTLIGIGDADTSDAWANLAVFGSALAPGGLLMGLANPELGQRQREVLTAFGSSMIAADMWGQDPERAAGQVLWNFGSLGLAGLGAVAKGGKLGRVGAIAGAAGRVSVASLFRTAVGSPLADLSRAGRLADQVVPQAPVLERIDMDPVPGTRGDVDVPAAPRADAGAGPALVEAPSAPDAPPVRDVGPAPVAAVPDAPSAGTPDAPGTPDAGHGDAPASPGQVPDSPSTGTPDAPTASESPSAGTPDVPNAPDAPNTPDSPSAGAPDAPADGGGAPTQDLGGPPRQAFESDLTTSDGAHAIDSNNPPLDTTGMSSTDRGKLGEDLTEADLLRQGYEILARQYHVLLPDGNGQFPDGKARYFVPDFIARAPDGSIVAVESKFGPNATYTRGQVDGYTYLTSKDAELRMRSEQRVEEMFQAEVFSVDRVVTYRWNTQIVPDDGLRAQADAIAAARPPRR
jgi:hypothetical protein